MTMDLAVMGAKIGYVTRLLFSTSLESVLTIIWFGMLLLVVATLGAVLNSDED